MFIKAYHYFSSEVAFLDEQVVRDRGYLNQFKASISSVDTSNFFNKARYCIGLFVP